MKLRVFPPAGSPFDAELRGSVTIGRDAKCDVTISDGKASSTHAVIEITGSGKVQLRDLGSTNGTLMNGTKVDADLMVVGDVVMIGEHRFMLWDAGRAPFFPADDPNGWRLLPRGDDGPPRGIVGRLTVGRSPECGLPIEHGTVSSLHATLTVDAGELTVEDHGSSNGTWVGGTKVRRSPLRHGDVVAFGDVAFFAQHGNRELPQVKEAEKRNIRNAALAIVAVLAAGILGISVWQGSDRAGPPAPAPTPSPDGGGGESAGHATVRADAGVLTMDLQGRFAIDAAGGAQIRNGAVVLLDESGAVLGHQHDADPGPGRAALLVGRTAEGVLAPGSERPTIFKLSGGASPSGLLTLSAAIGAPGTPVIAGLRIDLPPGTIPTMHSGPNGPQTVRGAAFAAPEVDELVIACNDQTLSLQFDSNWSLRGRPAHGGWELLIWKRDDAALTLDVELGARTRADKAWMAKTRSKAEAAMARSDYAGAVTLWTELLGHVGARDPAAPELQMRLDEATRAAK